MVVFPLSCQFSGRSTTWRSWASMGPTLIRGDEANLLLKKLMFGAPGYVVIWCSRASCHWSCWETKIVKEPGLKNRVAKDIWCSYRNNVIQNYPWNTRMIFTIFFLGILVFTLTTTFGMVWFLFSINLLEWLLGVWGAIWHKYCNSNGSVIRRNFEFQMPAKLYISICFRHFIFRFYWRRTQELHRGIVILIYIQLYVYIYIYIHYVR